MRERDQVAQGAENIAEVVIANVEIEKSTNVHNDVQLEMPLPDVTFLGRLTFEVHPRISLIKAVQHFTSVWWAPGQGQI